VWWFGDAVMFFEVGHARLDERELDEPSPSSMSRENAVSYLMQAIDPDRFLHIGDVPFYLEGHVFDPKTGSVRAPRAPPPLGAVLAHVEALER
jgi:hypothetical protein